MQYENLTTLVAILAKHTGRSEFTIARWCGVHGRLFKRLRENRGCRVDTYNQATAALSEIWPDDLEWPRAIPRPSQKRSAA